MKTTNPTKKGNKIVSALAAGIFAVTSLVGTTYPAFAEDSISLSIERQIFQVCQYQSAVGGAPLSIEEERTLMTTIGDGISDYALENNCSYYEAGKLILSEMMTESGLDSLPENMIVTYGSDKDTDEGGGTYEIVQLPTSDVGNIFFADNEWAWNHVGMYTSTTEIIEAVPGNGVQNVSIYSTDGKQHRVADSHNDSCILKVDGAGSSGRQGAVKWALPYVGCDYSSNFLFNKESDESVFNCSELVWKAYKNGKYKSMGGVEVVMGIDLDSNGGLAVYPNNIKNSSKVSKVCTW